MQDGEGLDKEGDNGKAEELLDHGYILKIALTIILGRMKVV